MDIKPYPYPLSVIHGQSYNNVFDATLNGSAWNLTGYTATLTVRKAATANSPVILQLTSGSGITLANGSFTIDITDEQTNSIQAGDYTYDLWFYSGGEAYPIFLAKFTVKASVTHV